MGTFRLAWGRDAHNKQKRKRGGAVSELGRVNRHEEGADVVYGYMLCLYTTHAYKACI